MRKRSSQRLVAVIILPYFLAACTTWQRQDLNTFPSLIAETQPARLQVKTQGMGTVELQDPIILDAALVALGSREGFTVREFMQIPLLEVLEVSIRGTSVPGSIAMGVASLGVVLTIIGVGRAR